MCRQSASPWGNSVATKARDLQECREHDVRPTPLSAMDQKIIANMRARVDMCRRLAETTHDERTAKILRQMADEGDADIRRLEAEAAAAPRGEPDEPRA